MKITAKRWKGNKLLFVILSIAMVLVLCLTAVPTIPTYAAEGLTLHTDYPGIAVKPGDSLKIPIEIQNTSGSAMDVKIAAASLPENWEGYIQGGSFQVNMIRVKSGENAASATLHLDVPKELTEGTYYAEVQASSASGAQSSLQLAFEVSTKKAGAGSFTSEYPQQEGASGTSFSFSTTLINNGLTSKSYSLSSNAPAGWKVSFTPSAENTKIAGIDPAVQFLQMRH